MKSNSSKPLLVIHYPLTTMCSVPAPLGYETIIYGFLSPQQGFGTLGLPFFRGKCLNSPIMRGISPPSFFPFAEPPFSSFLITEDHVKREPELFQVMLANEAVLEGAADLNVFGEFVAGTQGQRQIAVAGD